MRGFSTLEYIHVMNMVRQYHSFGRLHTTIDENHIKEKYPNYKFLNIKYVDTCFDTRTNSIWNITFRNGGVKYNFSTTYERKDYENLFDLVMSFLEGNENSKDFIID